MTPRDREVESLTSVSKHCTYCGHMSISECTSMKCTCKHCICHEIYQMEE